MRPISIEGLMRQEPHDPGLPPQLEWLSIGQLFIDPEYQREVKNDGRRAIERIAREFSWSKFSTVIVSPVFVPGSEGEADGEIRYAIIDGQHRTTAAKLAGYERVPCQILRLDRPAQAASFAAINGQVTKVTTWNLYEAALAAGAEWATTAARVCEAAGCRLMTNNNSTIAKQGGELYGVVTIRELIAKHGAPLVTVALGAYRRGVYGDLPAAWSNVYVLAWIVAVSQCKGAADLGAERLAKFHDSFDVMATDDEVVAWLRAQKREGKPAPAHWDALAMRISDALDGFVKPKREAA